MTDRIASTTAAVFDGPGSGFRLQELPIPPLKSGELLVRVELCTLCGSDLHSYSGRRPCAIPTVLGHEMIGRVVELSGPVNDLRGDPVEVGDRVAWTLTVSCGACFFCEAGLPQKCEGVVKYGHETLEQFGPLGGLAEHCRLLAGTGLCRLDDRIDDRAAAPANCCTATAAAALRIAGNVKERTLLVLGAGALGLTAAAMAVAKGAGQVVLVDVDSERLEQAGRLPGCQALAAEGMQERLRDMTGGRGADVVLEMSGATEAVEAGIGSARTGGRVVLVGSVFPGRAIELAPEAVVRRLLRIEGVHNYRPDDLLEAITFLEECSTDSIARQLVEHEMPLTDVDEAFRFALEKRPLRVGVRP